MRKRLSRTVTVDLTPRQRPEATVRPEPAESGLLEAPPVAAGPGVLVVPVLGWRTRVDSLDSPDCRLVGLLVLVDAGPDWVAIDGSRDAYPAAENSPPPPLEEARMLALAATVTADAEGVVFSPLEHSSWSGVTVGRGGEVRRG